MAPLIVLLATFIISLLILKLVKKEYRTAFAGRIALSVMLIFTAAGHFLYTEGMEMMIPSFIPFPRETVYLTAFFEIGAAIGIHIKKYRKAAGLLLILFFIAVLPANIKAAIEGIDYTTGTYEGSGPGYLWFRVPLQVLFILWTYVSVVRK
jgi:uncharacterized membrane protein